MTAPATKRTWRDIRRDQIVAEMNRTQTRLTAQQSNQRAVGWHRARLAALRQEMDDLDREGSMPTKSEE
jgi:hypothetical protein